MRGGILVPLDRKPARVALALLRLGAALLLALLGTLRLGGLASFPETALFLGIQAALALGLALTRLSTPLACALGLPLPLAARALAMLLMGTAAAAPERDLGFLVLDWSVLPFVALLCYGHIMAVWAFRSPKLSVPVGLGLELLALGLLSWDLAGNSSAAFAFPLAHAALVGALALLGIAALLLRARVVGGAGSRAAIALVALLPLAAIAAFFAFDRFSDASAAAKGGLLREKDLGFDFEENPTLRDRIDPGEPRLLFFVHLAGYPDRQLLRRYVLAAYEERRGFRVDPADPYTARLPAEAPSVRTRFPPPQAQAREDLDQEYYLTGVDPSSFLALAEPVDYAPLGAPEGFTAAYRVRSSAPLPGGRRRTTALDAVAAPGPADMEGDSFALCTEPPADPRIRELAAAVAGGRAGYHARVMAVLRYLKEGYLYSLAPGYAADGDQLAHFLFASKKGYCTYFAYSMALMLRALGIPCRVAAGARIIGDRQPFDIYPVTTTMAHAWVEVFYPGYGWIDLDPTSDNPAPEDAGGLPGMPPQSDWSSYLKSILAARAARAEADPGLDGAPRPAGIAEFLGALLAHWWAILLGLWLGAASVAEAIPRLRVLAARGDRGRLAARYALFERECAAAGFRARPGETGLERARRIRAELGIDLGALHADLDRARYAPDWPGPDPAALAFARGQLRALGRLPRRIAARLDPRFFLRRQP